MKKIEIILIMLLMLCGCNTKKEETVTEVIDVKETISEIKERNTISHISEDKKETVYVTADPYGNVQKTEVEVILKATDTDTIEDISDLKDIRNTGEDEKFTIEGNVISFENKGNDIHYKGTSDKQLPVILNISYYLNGNEISADDLKGKSGDLEIRFDYRNNSRRFVNGLELIDPFAAFTIVMLDNDIFQDVEIENGKLIEYGDVKAAVIMSLPGLESALNLKNYKLTEDIELKDYGVIKAKVSDFALDYTATILSNGIFKEIEDEDLKDIDEFINDSKDFESDSKELTDNTSKLYDASTELRSALKQYTGGVSSIDSYLGQSVDALNQYSEAVKGLKQFPQVIEVINRIVKEKEDALTKITNLIDSTDLSKEDKEKEKEIFSEYLNKIDTDIDNAKLEDKEKALLDEDANNLIMIYMTDIKFRNYLGMLENGAAALNEGLQKIKEGSATLSANNKTVNDGLDTLVDAAKEFDDGMNDFVENDLNDLLELSGSPLKNVVDRIRGLRKLDNEYSCYTGLIEGKKGSTTFIIETAEIK